MYKKVYAVVGFVALALVVGVVLSKSKNVNAPVITVGSESLAGVYAMSDVEQHRTEDDCWMAVNGNVYDVTSYIPSHPNQDIVDGCGKEATAMFENERKHRGKATDMLNDYLIGSLVSK